MQDSQLVNQHFLGKEINYNLGIRLKHCAKYWKCVYSIILIPRVLVLNLSCPP
jgi:hypothetical protein